MTGFESGAMNPAEAMKAHEAKMERQRTVDAKVAGIRNNPGETRSEDEIRAQAEQEVDAGSASSSSPDKKAPVYFRRYDQSSWPNQQAWEAEHAEEMEREIEIIRKDLEKFRKTQSDETTRWQAVARIQARQEGERLVESGRMDELIDRAIDAYLKPPYRRDRDEEADDRNFIEKNRDALRQGIFDRLKNQPVHPDDKAKETTDYLRTIVSTWISDKKYSD